MYGENIKIFARKLVRLHTGDVLAMSYPVEFVPRSELTKGGKLIVGPLLNCVAVVERNGSRIIRGTDGGR